MTIINGSSLPPHAVLTESQQACCELLEETLSLAREGKISSVAIGACHVDGLATVIAGTQAADLNLCLDDLKHKIRAAIFEDGNVAPKVSRKSNILRVR